MEWLGVIIGLISLIPLAKSLIQSVRPWQDKRQQDQDKEFERYREAHRKAFGKIRLPADQPTTMWIVSPKAIKH